MNNSFEIGLIAAAMNSGGARPKREHPAWPLVRTSHKPTPVTKTTATTAAAESEQGSIRYSTDSESLMKDSTSSTTQTKKSSLLKKIMGRTSK